MSRNVQYNKPTVPKFLQQFKQQVGFKEGPSVEDKFQTSEPAPPDDRSDNEDEQPVVVVLKSGDLTKEEAQSITKKRKKGKLRTAWFAVDTNEEEAENSGADGKVMYCPPSKKSKDDEMPGKTKKPKKTKSSSKAVKNASLLSFGDDSEEEKS